MSERQELFEIDKIVYKTEDFEVAYGYFNFDKQYYLGMRWTHTKKGYPVSKGGKPQWFMLENSFAIPILSHLLTRENQNSEIIKEILKKCLD